MNQQLEPELALKELDQVERAIGTSSQWLETLTARRDDLVRILDEATMPRVHVQGPCTRTIFRGLEYRSEIVVKWTFIDIHLFILRRLWSDFPDRRDAMATAMAMRGTSRRYVAKSPVELFEAKSEQWARQYRAPLADGWYADTNLNAERMKAILPAAARAAGLRWGEDASFGARLRCRRLITEHW